MVPFKKALVSSFGAAFALSLAAIAPCSPSGGASANVAQPAAGSNVRESGESASGKTVSKKASAATPRGWNTFRGSLQRTGRADARGPRSAKLKWVFRTEGRVYADAAVAADGTVYVASHDHRLYAVDPEGREIWAYDSGGEIWSSPAIGPDGAIYFGSDSDRLIALEPSGVLRWSFHTSDEETTGRNEASGEWDVDTSPLIAPDGTVIFGCNASLYAIWPQGQMRWLFKADAGKAKLFSSPAMGHDGSIYFGTQGDLFFSLSQGEKVLWKLKTQGDVDSTPAVGDDSTVYFAADDGKVRAAAPGGSLKWETDLGAPIRAPLAIGRDNTVFASACGQSPFLAALDGSTGSEKWRFAIERGEGDMYGIQSGALIDSEGYVYFGGRDRYVYCLSPEGRLVWRYETGDEVDSGPVMGPDGTVYVGSDDKRVYAFSPDV